jgi:MoaA/NifB/PqqE/SkfB family radical SAM enzyme
MARGWWDRLRVFGRARSAPQPLKSASPGTSELEAGAPVAAAAARDTFCVLAWNHLQIAPNGTVKMCCIASEDISDGRRTMSLYTDTYDEIWNSTYMRDARRGLANGEKISPCLRCFKEEDAVGQSRRTIQNAAWLTKAHQSREQLIETARSNDWRVPERPIFLQLNMGNLCNLACRMCSSQYSSKIEHDPVHNKWMPAAYPDVARWRGRKLHIGPRPFFGVAYTGFYDYEAGGHGAVRWASGKGAIKFKIPQGSEIEAVGLSLRTVGTTLPGIVRVNGLEVFEGVFTPEWTRRFELPGLHNHPGLEIEVESVAKDVGGRELGVGLLDAWIERKATGPRLSNDRTLMRYTANEGWWAQPEVMFDEILGQPDRLECIIFQGGEPFLVKEFERILDVLIANGSASKVTFEIISNLTTIEDSTLSKLANLKQLVLGASIDGIGPILEYIRYPAVWADIERNLERFSTLPNVVLTFNTAVQAYNLGDVVNILSYCDRRGIDVHMHFLVGPAYLNVAVLPPSVRRAAIAQVDAYLTGDDIRPANRHSAEYVTRFLREHIGIQYRDQFNWFVKFTNDMDVSRGQSFKALYPELIEAFADDGLNWTDETEFAQAAMVA